MGVQFSEQQRSVVENRGGNLLVSAAAGSGKTTRADRAASNAAVQSTGSFWMQFMSVMLCFIQMALFFLKRR